MLNNQGRSAMPDYQIIAAIANIPVDKAREILALADFRRSELARWDMERWLKKAGIGYAKATALATSFGLGGRRMFEQPDRKIKIHCSQDAYNCIKPFLYDELAKHFYIMLLDRNSGNEKLIRIFIWIY